MQITVPKYFEDIIKRYLKQTFYTAQNRAVFADREFTSKDLRFFAEGASALSDLFTSERASLPLNYLNDKKLRAGYLLYFLPLNFCKAQGVLQQLPLAFFKKNRFKILDMGCGPGTFTLGFIDYLLQREIVSKKEKVIIEILALDHNYHILKDADLLHAEIGKYLKAQGCEWRVVISAKTFDLRRGKPDTLL
ncbi:MAG: hypothetical protein JNK65_07125, partial [Deltaproteobacteria bacterium]|nr:hypothetical protein [Deltaproteobacteria bacterium]